MSDVYNNNREPISETDSESSNRPYVPGKFYNGNTAKKGGFKLEGEGSLGAAYDQGAIRYSEIPEIKYLSVSEDNAINCIPLGKQGSAAHLKQ